MTFVFISVLGHLNIHDREQSIYTIRVKKRNDLPINLSLLSDISSFSSSSCFNLHLSSLFSEAP